MSEGGQPGFVPLRRPLVFAIVGALVPAIFAAVALLGWDYYGRERDRQLRDSLATARAMAAAVEAELHGVESALFALGTSPYLAAGDLAAFHRQASAALARQRFINIVLLDAKLAQQVNTLRAFDAPLPAQQAAPRELAQVRETRRPVITGLFTGPVAGRALIAIGVPVALADGSTGVLAAGVTPERLSGILAQQHLPPDWVAAIFDSAGTIVARTHDPQRFVGQRAAPDLLRAMAAAQEGQVQSRTLEGIPVVSVFSHSPPSGWTVAIGIPLEYFTTHLLYSLARLFLVAFIMLLVALALALAIARRMTGEARR